MKQLTKLNKNNKIKNDIINNFAINLILFGFLKRINIKIITQKKNKISKPKLIEYKKSTIIKLKIIYVLTKNTDDTLQLNKILLLH